MKFGSIGDTHGRPYWKKFVENNPQIDKWVLIGDFPDSNKYKPIEVVYNLKEIIHFKKTNPDKVILLLGNHCIQYYFFPNYRCSGFQNSIAYELQQLYLENKHLFQVAYQHKNYIWTHAGISNRWYDKHKDEIESVRKRIGATNIAECLNYINGTKEAHILHEISHHRGGIMNAGGITWADFKETFNDALVGYKQVCGHTSVKHIQMIGDDKTNITYIDCLGTVEDFYKLEIND